jgi:creatinine amidohydrolase
MPGPGSPWKANEEEAGRLPRAVPDRPRADGDTAPEAREFRMELMRPGELNAERERCPLVFVPVAPLEYHGPHLPVGTDPINAAQCAFQACRRLGRGVVHPPLYWGTERERPDWMLESLGLPPGGWVVGMDFPAAIWRSHYHPEHLFALVVAATVEMLIRGSYEVIVLVNGHGAANQVATLERLAAHYSHSGGATVIARLAFAAEAGAEAGHADAAAAGHADLTETSLMLHLQRQAYGREDRVDLGQLPGREVPLRYPEFSIVDAPGFSRSPDPERIVRADPRQASAEKGREIFERTVAMLVGLAQEALDRRGR